MADRLGSRARNASLAVWDLFVACWHTITARDHRGYAAANPENGVDGTSLITFLSTFGVLQVAGLLALIREQEEKKYIVLLAYTVLAWGTVLSIYCVISRTVTAAPTVPPALPVNRPYYDLKTISFGLLMLCWLIPLAFLLPVAGHYNMLPGQEERRFFPQEKEILLKPAVQVTTRSDVNEQLVGNSASEEDRLLQKWYEWMRSKSPDERLIFSLQDVAFDHDYQSFRREVNLSGDFDRLDQVAFLYRNLGSGATYQPQYRQLKFVTEYKGGFRETNVLDIRTPNKGEKILLLLRVSPKDKTKSSSNYQVSLGKENK